MLWLWAPVVAYMAAIFFVSGMQSPPLPEQVSDKTGHLMAYAGLAVLSVRAVGRGLPCRVTPRVAWLALVIAGGYGVFDEIHQLFVPGRSGDLFDWFADVSGAVLGIGACWLWGMIASRHRV
jgi:VanZ family protein